MALQRCEHSLLQIDRKILFQRKCLVKLLNYVGDGIEGREAKIKAQLAQIASLEMEKGHDEDALQQQTLKTLELINIADIAIERVNLENDTDRLYKKRGELDAMEADLLKEQRRREAKRKRKQQSNA